MPSFALWTNSLSSSKPRLGAREYNLALDFFCHWIGNYEERLIYSVKTAKHLLTFTNNTWFHPQQVIWDMICARASVYLVCNTIMSCVDKKKLFVFWHFICICHSMRQCLCWAYFEAVYQQPTTKPHHRTNDKTEFPVSIFAIDSLALSRIVLEYMRRRSHSGTLYAVQLLRAPQFSFHFYHSEKSVALWIRCACC